MRDVNPNAINRNAVCFSPRRLLLSRFACSFHTVARTFHTVARTFHTVARTSECRSLFQNVVRFFRISFAFPEYRSLFQNILRSSRATLIRMRKSGPLAEIESLLSADLCVARGRGKRLDRSRSRRAVSPKTSPPLH